ncbi:uncharacterized protein LOC144104773 [Amblyomma americanum]
MHPCLAFHAILATCAIGSLATNAGLTLVPGAPNPLQQKLPPKPPQTQVATSALGGGLVPDWARPSALLQTIVDRIRGTNRPCASLSGVETGSCVAHFNCASTGGVVISSTECVHPTVCCKVPEEVPSVVTCGGAINSNQTSFRNPDFPADFRRAGMCSVEVTFGREVCQLRLDFVHFSLAAPRASGPRAGLCDDDVFTVTTGLGSTTYPALCGQNAGQHMYVDVSEATRAVLSFNIGSDVPVGRKWHVRVSTVHCLSPVKAPDSCLQYFTAPSGEFTSFNFLPSAQSQQLIAGLKYSVCFKKQLGFCQITYSPSEPNLFQMGRAAEPLTGARNCEDAYLFVPSGSNKAFLDDVTSDRFCGRGFPGGAVSSDVLPFTVAVVTSRPRGTTSGLGTAVGRAFDGSPNVTLGNDGRRGVPLQAFQQQHQQKVGTQVGFVRGPFSVIKHVPHNLQNKPQHPHHSVITVVETPDLAAGTGVKEPPSAATAAALDARNPHVGGFRLRYIMNHCN